MSKHTKESIDFCHWFRMLQGIAPQYGYEISFHDQECWQNFYDDGYSPREALDDDTYNGL